jgi:hypothetical protein
LEREDSKRPATAAVRSSGDAVSSFRQTSSSPTCIARLESNVGTLRVPFSVEAVLEHEQLGIWSLRHGTLVYSP